MSLFLLVLLVLLVSAAGLAIGAPFGKTLHKGGCARDVASSCARSAAGSCGAIDTTQRSESAAQD